MSESARKLGPSVSQYTTSPANLQRAAIVSVVSFAFFLAMLAAFYLRQQIGFFLLSTGFLVVYIITSIGWVLQKRNFVTIYENGISYRKFRAVWDEIQSVTAGKNGLEIASSRRDKIIIPTSMSGYNEIVNAVKRGLDKDPFSYSGE